VYFCSRNDILYSAQEKIKSTGYGGTAEVMNEKIEYHVNNLAYHLWISAGREYGRALEFWMMAEQMVWELALASARLSGSAVEAGTAAELTAPAIAAKSVRRIRELAYSMWQAAGAEWGRAVDYWLAAERHITTMLMVPGAVAEPSNAKPLKDELLDAGPVDAEPSDLDAERNTQPVSNRFSAEEYLNAIRRDAYDMWEKAGRQYGENALAFWLEAERQMLHRLEAVAMAHLYAPEPANYNAELQPLQPDISETPLASERGNTAGAAVREPSPFRIRRLNSA
jgi:hypothetical protein